jgi:hypothetical protein
MRTIDASSLYRVVAASLYDILGIRSLFSAIRHSKRERFVLPPKNLPKVIDFLLSGESEFIETAFRLLFLVNDAK